MSTFAETLLVEKKETDFLNRTFPLYPDDYCNEDARGGGHVECGGDTWSARVGGERSGA